jgi:IS30 family transposase
VPGHWEGDLLSGSKNSYIATLVERHTRYVMLAKVANKDTQTVVSSLIKQAKKLPRSSTIYVDDQHRRLLLRSAKPVAARVE